MRSSRFRAAMLWCAVAASVWCGADLMFGQTVTKPSGLTIRVGNYMGMQPVLTLEATDAGNGSPCNTVIYQSGGVIYDIGGTCTFTPGIFKAGTNHQFYSINETSATWDTGHQAIWDAITADTVGYNSLPDGNATAACPDGVQWNCWNPFTGQITANVPGFPGQFIPLGLAKALTMLTNGDPGFGGACLTTYQNVNPDWNAVGACMNCSCGWFAVLGQPGADQILAQTCDGDCAYRADTPNGAYNMNCCQPGYPPPPTCDGTCYYTWIAGMNGNPGQWHYWQGSCQNSGECSCCPPTYSGSFSGETGMGSCGLPGRTCDPVQPPPCFNEGGDYDGDGCCDNVDCNPTNSQQCDNCPPPPPGPCDENGGDTDGDGCCDDVDCYTDDPERCECEPDCPDGDEDEDGCCADEDEDDSDPEVCEPEDDDGDGCGRCKWRLKQTNEDSEEEDPVYEWEKIESCDDDSCECQPPEEDPNSEEALEDRVKYTDCDPECWCGFNFTTEAQQLQAKLVRWWPSLSPQSSSSVVQWQLQLPYMGSTGQINLTISADPTNWNYFSSVGTTAANWLKAWLALCFALFFFWRVIADIQTL